MKNILFLCTGNSCRSQMAEGFCRHFHGSTVNAYSAGVKTHGLNPHAVTVMKEVGIDISKQKSQLLDEFQEINFDLVVTVCDNAKESCPYFPGNAKITHRSFEDPPALTKELEDIEKILPIYRKVRDQISDFIQNQLNLELLQA